MKFYTIFALVASVAAIRVTTHSETKIKADIKKATDEALIQLATSILLQHDSEKDWIDWLRQEAKSDDGLTWDELKAELTKCAEEHNVTLKDSDWDHIKECFDAADTDGSGSVDEKELEAALNAHGH